MLKLYREEDDGDDDDDKTTKAVVVMLMMMIMMVMWCLYFSPHRIRNFRHLSSQYYRILRSRVKRNNSCITVGTKKVLIESLQIITVTFYQDHIKRFLNFISVIKCHFYIILLNFQKIINESNNIIVKNNPQFHTYIPSTALENQVVV